MVGKRGQPDKGHLEENDVVLKVIFPLTDMFTYMVVENMDREELLAQLQSYHELYGRSSEMTVETFLEGQGARLIPWYDSAGLMVEKPVCFYDFEYEYDTGIVNVAAFSAEEQAEMLISRAEYQETVFDGQDKNLIIEYAKKFDDMDAVKGLAWELAEAEKASDLQAVQRIRSHARAEIDKFPDRKLGLSAMHWMGYHDDSMLPLTRERALELYRDGLDIYSLQADGRAFLMSLEGDFYEEKGIFGVKAEEWEDYREMEPGLAHGSRGMYEPFIAQYYVIQDNADGRKAEKECQYFSDLNAAVTAYHQIPSHLDKQIGMESTEQPPARMSLIECRNGIETLTDIESCSLNGKWMCRETMEASEKAGKYLEGCYKEIAFRTGEGYFSIQTVSDGYDYTIYDSDFREIDGGVYDNPDISIHEAMEDVLSDEGISMDACKVMDYEELLEKTEAVAQEDLKKGQEKVLGRKLLADRQAEQDAKISFYVAECMEFPVLGEYYENIGTLQEAMELYEKIPSDRMHGVKGVGFCLEDGSIYAGKFELMSGREVLAGIINDIPHYKESPLVQKAVADMEALLSGQAARSVTDGGKRAGTSSETGGCSKSSDRRSKNKRGSPAESGRKSVCRRDRQGRV